MKTAPVVATERFELWRPRVGDLAGLHAMMSDPETVRFVGGKVPSEADNFARIMRNAGSWSLYGYGVFMVRPKGEDRIVGSCGVFRSHRGFGSELGFDDAAEAGWIVHRDLWGQGAASEIMRAVLAWFDAAHGPQRLVCMIEEGNAASVRVAEKLGFTQIGTHRSEDDASLLLFRR